jgi:hypothetical protein
VSFLAIAKIQPVKSKGRKLVFGRLFHFPFSNQDEKQESGSPTSIPLKWTRNLIDGFVNAWQISWKVHSLSSNDAVLSPCRTTIFWRGKTVGTITLFICSTRIEFIRLLMKDYVLVIRLTVHSIRLATWQFFTFHLLQASIFYKNWRCKKPTASLTAAVLISN